MAEPKVKKNKRLLYVEMPEASWEVLRYFTFIIQARTRNYPGNLTSSGQVVGAILTRFFLAHHEEIRAGAASEFSAKAEQAIQRLLDSEQLDQLADDEGVSIPEAERDSGPSDDGSTSPIGVTRASAASRSIQWTDERPRRDPSSRHPRSPREVQPGGVDTGPADPREAEEPRDPGSE